jgi:hypothetical protein
MLVMPRMGFLSGRIIDVADVPVLFRATDSTRADALEDFLAGFTPATGPERASVRLGARLPVMPKRRPDRVVDGFDLWTSGATLHARLGAIARLSADESSAVVGAIDGNGSRAFPVAFLFFATHLLAHRDRFLLHAGAVVHGDRAYVVVGGTGAGKSTLVAATLDSEWAALADDMVVVRVDGAGPRVIGIRRAVAVPGDVDVPRAAAPARDDARGRRIVPPTALEAGWFPVAGVIAVGHGAAPGGALSKLSGHDALRVLVRSFTSGANPDLVRRFLGPAAALAGMPGWRLEHGADAAGRLRSARRLLDDVLAGARTHP